MCAICIGPMFTILGIVFVIWGSGDLQSKEASCNNSHGSDGRYSNVCGSNCCIQPCAITQADGNFCESYSSAMKPQLITGAIFLALGVLALARLAYMIKFDAAQQQQPQSNFQLMGGPGYKPPMQAGKATATATGTYVQQPAPVQVATAMYVNQQEVPMAAAPTSQWQQPATAQTATYIQKPGV